MTTPENFCTGCQLENPNPSIGFFSDDKGKFLGLMPTCRNCGRPVGPRRDGQPEPEAQLKPLVSQHGQQLVLPAMPALPALPQPLAHVTPGGLIKQAKQRVKELTAFLRECQKLEQERDELKRLIAASKAVRAKRSQPLAKVRSLTG